MVRWHISRAYLCSPRLGVSTDRVGEPLFSLLRALPNGWFSALPNRCFCPGHMWSSRLSRGLTWAVHGPRGRTPCRTAVFSPAALPNRCFCPGHMWSSRLSRGLTWAVHGPRGRTPCRTLLFGRAALPNRCFCPGHACGSRLSRDVVRGLLSFSSARTPCRTAVFSPAALPNCCFCPGHACGTRLSRGLGPSTDHVGGLLSSGTDAWTNRCFCPTSALGCRRPVT